MKILVDELPYYQDDCPFWDRCADRFGVGGFDKSFPRNWSKYYVCSPKNPHECVMLKEYMDEKREKEWEESYYTEEQELLGDE